MLNGESEGILRRRNPRATERSVRPRDASNHSDAPRRPVAPQARACAEGGSPPTNRRENPEPTPPRETGSYRSSSSTTNVPGIIGGRGRGRSAVGAGAGPNSAVTV